VRAGLFCAECAEALKVVFAIHSLAYALYLQDTQVRGGLVCVQAYFALNVLKR